MPTPYSREHEYDLEENEDTVVETEVSTPATTPQEESWAKRYSDLRRHQQQSEAALKAEIEALKKAPTQVQPPKTEAELTAWMRKYPDVAGLVKTLIMKELEPHREEVTTIRKQTAEEKHKAAVADAQRQLANEHPDFFNDIINRDDFHDWLAGKSQAVYDALYVNELDWKRASEVVDLYKYETGTAKRKYNKREAASDIPNRTASTRVGDGTEKVWKESEIDRMSAAEFEANEEDITKAYREGRIDLDLSGAAR